MLLNACAQVNTTVPAGSELTPPQINVLVGLRHWRNHQPRLALGKINEALAEDPQLASAHNLAGLIYDRLEQLDLAEWHFKRALSLNPNDPSAHNNYGMLLCNQSRLAQAEKNFLTAADNPNNVSPEVAYTNAGLCVRRLPDIDRAAQYFIAALNADPKFPTALFQIARISFQKGRYPQARRNLQQYLQVGRHTSETLWLAVRIERALGHSERARNYAQQLQNAFPQSKETQALFNSKARSSYELISPNRAAPLTAGAVRVTTSTSNGFKRTDWVRAQDPQDYTVQLFASQNEAAMPYFRDQYHLSGELAYFAAPQSNGIWYTLVWGEFADRQQAEKAISQLPEQLHSSARVREFGAIQAELAAPG
jgi:type IV pilus assembly protein PilF